MQGSEFVEVETNVRLHILNNFCTGKHCQGCLGCGASQSQTRGHYRRRARGAKDIWKFDEILARDTCVKYR